MFASVKLKCHVTSPIGHDRPVLLSSSAMGKKLSAKSIRTATDSHSTLFLELANWTAPPLWRAPTTMRHLRSAPIRKRAAKLNDPGSSDHQTPVLSSAFLPSPEPVNTKQWPDDKTRLTGMTSRLLHQQHGSGFVFLVGIRPILVCSGACDTGGWEGSRVRLLACICLSPPPRHDGTGKVS